MKKVIYSILISVLISACSTCEVSECDQGNCLDKVCECVAPFIGPDCDVNSNSVLNGDYVSQRVHRIKLNGDSGVVDNPFYFDIEAGRESYLNSNQINWLSNTEFEVIDLSGDEVVGKGFVESGDSIRYWTEEYDGVFQRKYYYGKRL